MQEDYFEYIDVINKKKYEEIKRRELLAKKQLISKQVISIISSMTITMTTSSLLYLISNNILSNIKVKSDNIGKYAFIGLTAISITILVLAFILFIRKNIYRSKIDKDNISKELCRLHSEIIISVQQNTKNIIKNGEIL